LVQGGLLLTAAQLGGAAAWGADEPKSPPTTPLDPKAAPLARIGLLTDIHYADRPPAGSRHFRDSLEMVALSVAAFNEAKLDTLVFLGDLIDEAPDVEGEIGYLKKIDAELAKFKVERHFVLGNHCIWRLTKQQFADNSAAKAKHYSFDRHGHHFVILDACYRKDGVSYGAKNNAWNDSDIPREQQEWLRDDLKKTDKPTIVCVHQRLDVKGDHAVLQAPVVRKILEESGRVRAVLMGHSHKNNYREINGIHYCVLRAVIEGAGKENNSYATLDLFSDGTLRIDGFVQQKDYEWKAKMMAAKG
jgi:predicted MPP superfamily phosphohydrolase